MDKCNNPDCGWRDEGNDTNCILFATQGTMNEICKRLYDYRQSIKTAEEINKRLQRIIDENNIEEYPEVIWDGE